MGKLKKLNTSLPTDDLLAELDQIQIFGGSGEETTGTNIFCKTNCPCPPPTPPTNSDCNPCDGGDTCDGCKCGSGCECDHESSDTCDGGMCCCGEGCKCKEKGHGEGDGGNHIIGQFGWM